MTGLNELAAANARREQELCGLRARREREEQSVNRFLAREAFEAFCDVLESARLRDMEGL